MNMNLNRPIYLFMFTALEKGDTSVIFTSPEALNDKVIALLKNQRRRICLVAFDEVHCMSEW